MKTDMVNKNRFRKDRTVFLAFKSKYYKQTLINNLIASKKEVA